MSEVASQAGELMDSSAEKRLSVARLIFRLVLSLAAIATLTWSGLHWGQLNESLRHAWRIYHSAPPVLGTIVIAEAIALLTGILIFTNWNRALERRLLLQQDAWETERRALQLQALQSGRAEDESRRRVAELETDLERRTAILEQTNRRLQEELDRQKKAEKFLTQQRQELESSKNVLELHVQARTKELQQLQRRYELILNSAGEGICGLDAEGRATFVNPAAARITGWEICDLVGKSVEQIFELADPAELDDFEEVEKEVDVFYRKDGTNFPVELVKTPINENGEEVGAVLVFKDITERKRADEALSAKAAELARSNAELEQFAFVASHDLQEPLRKIQAFGDRVKANCQAIQSPETIDYLERMQRAAERMQTLINDLLAFSRVIRSSEPFAPVDLNAVTREVLSDLEVRVEKTSARVEVGSLPVIHADALQMRQLMQNLISNALKFQLQGATPEVKVHAEIIERRNANWDTTLLRKRGNGADSILPSDKVCQLTVQDNGIGFEEKYLEKIFAVFQRLHGRSEYEGTGVGLAVCRRIVERHGGTISAHSEPGKGARFVISLPIQQKNGGAAK